jgi:hypothetical protein
MKAWYLVKYKKVYIYLFIFVIKYNNDINNIYNFSQIQHYFLLCIIDYRILFIIIFCNGFCKMVAK